MSAESLRIINKAIARINGDVIATVDDGTAEAIVADLNYEDLVKTELCKRAWKFARKLELLTADPDAPIDTDWDFALVLPATMLRLRTVIKDGKSIDYELGVDETGTQFILTDDDQDVYAVFTYRAPEDNWPDDFNEGIVKRLESMFLRREERSVEADRRDQQAELDFRMAALRHAQEEPPKDPNRYPLIEARRLGSAPRRQ